MALSECGSSLCKLRVFHTNIQVHAFWLDEAYHGIRIEQIILAIIFYIMGLNKVLCQILLFFKSSAKLTH